MEEWEICGHKRDLLEFSDEIVLFDQDETEAIEYFHKIEFFAKKAGLNIKYYKKQIMIRNVNPRTEVIKGKLGMKVEESTVLEVANDFKYLGAYIANCHVDFKWCKGLAWSQF